MNKKVLIITVGGSDEPVVEAIKGYKPDFIYFICTGGKPEVASHITVDGKDVNKKIIINEKPCIRKKQIKCPDCGKLIQKEERFPSIIQQAEFKGDYEKIILHDPDDFSEVYEKIKICIDKAKEMGDVIADFTGGTKTMSSVLSLLCAFNFNISPSLVKGKRENIIKISEGSIPVRENFNLARIDYILKIAGNFVSRFLYYPAKIIIEDVLTKIELNGELEKKLREKRNFCEGFYLWDIFEYEKAFNVIKDEKSLTNYRDYLLKILGKTKSTGYEKVFDLICNAERQAENGFYENACARIYRTLELFAQIRLKKDYGIETGNLDLNKVKNKDYWENKRDNEGKIKIGLVDDYKLLLELEDEFGKVYAEEENTLKNILQIRNNSKLAHGDTPITEKDWKKILQFVKEFIENCCNRLKIKIEYLQLPRNFI